MKLRKDQEGKINFWIPTEDKYKASVFFNPEGELSRDISVSALQVFQKEFKKKITVCDALSGTGIRGLRYAKEVFGIKKVILNDKNPLAVKLIRKNIKENKLKNCLATKEDANLLLRKNVFIAIDIDPFGSPNIYLDSAARSIYHKGFLAVTATDQAALSGTYPEAGLRKYGIKPVKTEFYNELGIRILISFIILTLARYDRAFIPLLSFVSKHYYRAFGKIEHAGQISGLLKNFKYVSYCSCGNREIGIKEKCFCGKDFKIIGPIFTGSISNRNFCKKVLIDIKKRKFRLKKEEEKLLKLLIEEADSPAFYYDLHHLAKVLKNEPSKIEVLIEKLKSKGFKASRTHFCPTAIKTDASLKEILKLLSLKS
jgi:tRNA (guanine26-N2/guanine27-N2)-dimethyltransferase